MSTKLTEKTEYKKTKFGWIPQEWEIIELGNVCIFSQGIQVDLELQKKHSEPGYIPFLRIENYTQNSTDIRYIPQEVGKNKFVYKDDVVAVRYGATAGFIGRGLEGILANNLFKITPDENKLLKNYLFIQMSGPKTFDYFQDMMAGGAMPALSFGMIKSLELCIPPLPEQEKIAEVLTSWDNAIEKTEKLIEFKQKNKKAFMQSLLTGKLRFPQFAGHKWKTVKLKDIFEKVNRKNSENNHNILTISAQHGLVSQAEFYNKRIASVDTSKYILLKNGEFAYNKSYSKGYPMGAIKRLDKYDYGVVSSLYICFSSKVDNICSDFFSHFFEAGLLNNEIQIVAQEGARNHGLLNISSTDFFNIEFKIPSNKEEQQKIAAALNSCDREIEILKQKLSKLNEQKKGLMQKLLTGQVRVKLNKETG